MDCIFCKIINKEAPATILHEDDVCVVISTIEPVAPGHVLVVPKMHSTNVLDIDDAVLAHIAVVAKNMGQQLVTDQAAEGVNLLHAAGKAAQQSVFHFHMHVVPRYDHDGLDLWFRNNL